MGVLDFGVIMLPRPYVSRDALWSRWGVREYIYPNIYISFHTRVYVYMS